MLGMGNIMRNYVFRRPFDYQRFNRRLFIGLFPAAPAVGGGKAQLIFLTGEIA